MKNFSLQDFELINKNLKENIVGCRINNISLTNSRDYVLTLSMIKSEKLLVSLNHSSPFVTLAELDNVPSTIIGAANDNLRKYLKDAFIVSVDLLNNDRVLVFELQKANDLYEKEKSFLYIECVPQRPNLIITNENNIVLFAMHYSSINSNRCIVKGLEFIPLEGHLVKASESTKTLDEIKEFAKNYYQDSLQTRNKEKYNEVFKFIKIRVKSLTKKLVTLDNAIKDAKNKLDYQEIGSMLLAYSYDLDGLREYVSENNIEFDEKLTAGQNAEKYFKKYKKAKRTIEINEFEINKTKQEIERLEGILCMSSYMTDEELLIMAKELVPSKYKLGKMKKEPTFIGSVSVEGTKISFGKNAKANNELTFKIAKPYETYLHIKDFHGSHIIIHNAEPTNEMLLVASEIALLLSNKNGGEVYYTQIKYVKKGSSLGEANLLSYKTITLKSVRESTKHLLNK